MDRPVPESPTVPVLAAVIWRDGRVLLGLRPAHKRHGGLWEFPGGKLEIGESHLEGVRRELREELGVVVTRVGEVQFSTRDPGSAFVIHFLSVEIRGEPRALEHSRLDWFSPAAAAALPLAPSDAEFLSTLVGA